MNVPASGPVAGPRPPFDPEPASVRAVVRAHTPATMPFGIAQTVRAGEAALDRADEARGRGGEYEVRELSGFSSAFVDVGSAETSRDEAVAHASRLWRADVHAQPWRGFHGFQTAAPHAEVSRTSMTECAPGSAAYSTAEPR